MINILFADVSGGEWVGIVGVALAAVTLILAIGNKVYKSGQNAQKVKYIEQDLKDNIKPELKSLREAMAENAKEIRDKLADILQAMTLKQVSQAQSPRALNDFGKQVLSQSDIRSIIEPKLDQITQAVKAKNPENAYQVQEMLLDIIQDLKNDASLKNSIEQAAFKSGVSVETVLLVAGIDIRDTVLEQLNMKPDDIDIHKAKANKK
ncbi:MAG TPA: hypothetical protein VH234_01980 [Candidatus Saccharimonadales bacterium]|jgi:hypothetical protein|nr:hypothetical protein [Candidatus Saccharimonadales bacterium]